MALDKRKRKKVSEMVREVRELRNKVRTNRIEGNREDEYMDLAFLTEQIHSSKEKLGIKGEFDNDLQSFDSKLIVCHDTAVKTTRGWKIPKNKKKKQDIIDEITRLKNKGGESQIQEAMKKGKHATALELGALNGAFRPVPLD